jgi:hypothetical protein
MRRLPLSFLVLAVLALPAAAVAQPPGPEPSGPAVLRGSPYLVRDGDGRVTVGLRLDRAIARRFDGELLATAVVDGRFASLRSVARRRGARAHCYAASVVPASDRLGRLVTVSVLLGDPPETAVSALVAVREPRPGDARGAPLRC